MPSRSSVTGRVDANALGGPRPTFGAPDGGVSGPPFLPKDFDCSSSSACIDAAEIGFEKDAVLARPRDTGDLSQETTMVDIAKLMGTG